MELSERLHSQWVESAQDWIDTDQAVRTGMLDSWMLDALGNVGASRQSISDAAKAGSAACCPSSARQLPALTSPKPLLSGHAPSHPSAKPT